jgi:pyruvate dehydrogenase E2 component (dihydrolipoamide acetyltransferase)
MSDEIKGERKVDKRGVPIAQVTPLKGMRKKISEHMLQGHLSSAPVTTLMELDVTDLVALRKELNNHPEKTEGLKISYTHLMIKAISRALRKNPILNSAMVENEIQVFEDINIGVAVALPDGNLIVPVVHQADKKNILEVARRATDLQERAISGKLVVADVQKGTFTLTNTGVMPEARWGTPLLNQSQCAILGTGAIRQIPAVRDGQIVIRWVISTSLTYDHRIVNGIPVAYFMETLSQILGDPSKSELGI